MNLVLFREEETGSILPSSDPRAIHVLRVLGFGEGDSFDGGVINGSKGKVTIRAVRGEGLELEFSLDETPERLFPVTLAVGLPRPQTARKILREATALGASRIVFVHTSKSEPAYALSGLWKDGEYERCIIEGASQAFSTRLPEVEVLDGIGSFVITLPDCDRLALDNYEASCDLKDFIPAHAECVLAVGPERGWSGGERKTLTDTGFSLARLGRRVLRTETACVAGLALALAKAGFL
jgi:16S rRNA (uracil1498-N3)-methyltransferase